MRVGRGSERTVMRAWGEAADSRVFRGEGRGHGAQACWAGGGGSSSQTLSGRIRSVARPPEVSLCRFVLPSSSTTSSPAAALSSSSSRRGLTGARSLLTATSKKSLCHDAICCKALLFRLILKRGEAEPERDQAKLHIKDFSAVGQ